MKFKLVESIDDRLVEASYLTDLKHVFTNLANRQRKSSGMFSRIYKKHKKHIDDYFDKHNLNIDDWECHHMSSIHPISLKDKYNNIEYLALVLKSEHNNLDAFNFKYFLDVIYNKVKTDLNIEDDKIVSAFLHLYSICLVRNDMRLISKAADKILKDTLNNLGDILTKHVIDNLAELNKNGLRIIPLIDIVPKTV